MYETALKYRNKFFLARDQVPTIMLLFLCFVKQIKKDLRLKRIEEIVSRENAK
jgi:hypothetical protein